MSHLGLGQQLPLFKLPAATPSVLNRFAAEHPYNAKLQRNKRPKISYQATFTEATEAAPQMKGTNAAKWPERHVPAALANSVVRLDAANSRAPSGTTEVFLLGMSHVSKESVAAVRSLIAAVRPEVVLVELCKDRVGLMLNPDGPQGMQLWNSRRITLSGLPQAEGWPAEEEILSVLTTQPGRAFTTPDVEADCVRLLATGLFRSVRPSFKRPTGLDAPQFVKVKGNRLATVPPLGPVEFIVTPRVLPTPTAFSVRIDSSLASTDFEIPKEVAAINDTLLGEFAAEQKPPAIDALLRARRSLIELLTPRIQEAFDVGLRGIESGEIEAVIKAQQDSTRAFTTGLEGSAEGGEGPGIEAFRPQRGPLQISSNLRIPNLAKLMRGVGEHAEDFVVPIAPAERGTQWRLWTRKEMGEAESADSEEQEEGLSTRVAGALSQVYARFQNAAGERVGVKPGAAWREALEAAADHGGLQVHLGDMPANLAAKNLADGIWEGLASRVAAAGAVVAAVATAAAAHAIPSGTEGYAAASAAAAVGFATFPFLRPLVEVYLFSQRTAEQIEDTVRIKESLQARGQEMLKIPGEDAIINWPNAKETIIDRRDAFMARTLWAAATGSGASPAYILETSDERHAWHYAMPRDAPEGCSASGCGLGEYVPMENASAVVGIVGSAHVGGIVREWQDAAEQERLSRLLKAAAVHTDVSAD